MAVVQTGKIAAKHLLTAFIICGFINEVLSQPLYRYHISEEGGSLHAICPLYGQSYRTQWSWLGNDLLRPESDLYTQLRWYGEVVEGPGARPDTSLNKTDFSLTISSLQVKDTGLLGCRRYNRGPGVYSLIYLVVYNRRVEVMLGASVTLQCPLDTAVYTSRQWYTWDSTYLLLYNQTASGVIDGRYARNDTSLNVRTFELTIGNVTQQDYELTCVVTSGQLVKAATIFIAVFNVVVEAEEGESVTLPCHEVQRRTNQGFNDTGGSEPYSRTWQHVSGDLLYHQYYYGLFYDRRLTTRPDISLNNSTFSLSINRTQLSDSSMFICTYGGRKPGHVESVKLDIYVNPMIILSGVNDTPVSVGSTVTVTCTIARVYPELGPGDFLMRWGAQTFMSTGSQNGDKSYRYTVRNIHTVTNGDDDAMIECLVNPTRGRSEYITKKITLNSQNQNLQLPVIGGAVAAAVVVVIVIIVLSVCLCVRRKGQHSKVTGSPVVSSDERCYEKLKVRGTTLIEEWIKDKDVPQEAAQKLKQHDIVSFEHLQDMSRADMEEIGLNVGERNRIRKALKESSISQF